MTPNQNMTALSAQGVSVWLDDLSRDRLTTGNLQKLIDTRGVVGVTTNPSIFQAALSHGHAYDDQIAKLAGRGADAEAAILAATTDDVRAACDLLRPQWEASDGVDGRVSIEVDPRSAHDADKTTAEALALWKMVDRPNVMIKIPAMEDGLPAVTAVLAQGISVNVTLIFSVERYRAVMEAYLDGLEQAHNAGHDLSTIHSVASFFVSRVDAEIDTRLEKVGTNEALALCGRAGVANARLAYAAFQDVFTDGQSRFEKLTTHGARLQRPLWASTGVKNPDYPDTLYVTELVAPHTVNTMPEKTIDAGRRPRPDHRRHRDGARRPSTARVRPDRRARHRHHRRLPKPGKRRRQQIRESLARTTEHHHHPIGGRPLLISFQGASMLEAAYPMCRPCVRRASADAVHNTCCGGEAKGQRRDVGFSTIRNTPTPREVMSAPLREKTMTSPSATTT